MHLSDELRPVLFHARKWEDALVSRARELRSVPPSADVVPEARALAAALEDVALERSHAVEMHLLTSKAAGGDRLALARARALALELGDTALAARIAAMERKHCGDTALALLEGELWLDAGAADRAIRPLLLAAKERPRDPEVARALSTARHEWGDVRGEIQRLEDAAAARQDGGAAARELLQAAHIARMLGEGERARGLVRAAFVRDPASERAYALAERAGADDGDWDALIDVYRRRCDAVPEGAEVVETLRRGAMRLVSAGAPGLAVTVAARGLDYAYDVGIAEIPGHLALIGILYRHYVRVQAPEKMMQIAERGLAAAIPEDDATGLAITALDLAWNHLGAEASARRYAERVRAAAPESPILADYHRAPAPQVPGGASVAKGSAGAPEAERAGTGEAIPLDLDDLDDIEVTDGGAAGDSELEIADANAAGVPRGESAEAEARAKAASRPEHAEAEAGVEGGAVLDGSGAEGAGDETLDLAEGASIGEVAGAEKAVSASEAGARSALPEADVGDASALPETESGAAPALPEADVPDASSADESSRSAASARPSRGPSEASASAPRAPASAGSGSLIPGAAKRALEQIVRGPSPSPPGGAERRADPRTGVPADATARLEAAVSLGGGDARAVTRDLSRSGAFIVTDATLPEDGALDLTLTLPTADGAGVAEHALRARVVRREAGVGYGVCFEEPSAEYERAVAELLSRRGGQ